MEEECKMPTLAEIIKKHSEKFSAIEGAQDIVGKVTEVLKELGYDVVVNNKKDPEYLPKSRFDELTGVKNELKQQVADLTEELGKLKKSAKGNEELERKISELQQQLDDNAKKLKETAIKAAAKIEAIKLKAKDPEDLLKFIDFSKITMNDDETITGLNEQIKELSEKKTYLFEEKGQSDIGGGSNPPGGGGNGGVETNPWKKETFNLTQQGILLRKDPVKARKLAAEAGYKI